VSSPYLLELYGQVDWSVRAIYTQVLGWFDGRPDRLYRHPTQEIARREVTLLGGIEQVYGMAEQSLQDGDARWAIHLLAKLKDSRLTKGDTQERIDGTLADAYERLGGEIPNTNGRAYLLESSLERRQGPFTTSIPTPSDDLVSSIPLESIFSILATRLITEKAMDTNESVHFLFPDEERQFVVTVRNGIAEVVQGQPLPGSPEPVAVMQVDSGTYRRIALQQLNPVSAFASGDLKVKGSWIGFLKFMGRFQRGL
jgi:alkyl sulfatase BDS1-like metallo-beta-lactamase superfamily hydrolase